MELEGCIETYRNWGDNFPFLDPVKEGLMHEIISVTVRLRAVCDILVTVHAPEPSISVNECQCSRSFVEWTLGM